MRKATLLLALTWGVVSRAGATPIFSAALSGTDDVAVTASPGAVVAPGYLEGWLEPFLEFSTTTSPGATSQAYITIDLGAPQQTLLSRLMIEFGQAFAVTDSLKFIELVKDDGMTVEASVALTSMIRESGDTANQVASWVLRGLDVRNTAEHFYLYWTLANADGLRIVSLYRSPDGSPESLVAQGARYGNGILALYPANESGITGTVVVSHIADDTTLAENTVWQQLQYTPRIRSNGVMLSCTPGGAIDRFGLSELWVSWGAGAGSGWWGFGGQTGLRASAQCALYNNDENVRYIRFGIMEATGCHPGQLFLHELVAWNSRPVEAREIHDTACARYTAGVPAVVDVFGLPGRRVGRVDVSTDGTHWRNIGCMSRNGMRINAKAANAELIDPVLFDVPDGTFDGYLVEPTARPFRLYPPSQIINQVRDGAKACLIGYPAWIGLGGPDDNTTGNVYIPQTFDLWRVKEVSPGVYRVGIQASEVHPGRNFVRLMFVNGTSATAQFDAQRRTVMQIDPDQLHGRTLAVGFDDGFVTESSQFRSVFSGRRIRPYMSIMFGLAGESSFFPSPRVWHKLESAGVVIANHLWDNTRVNAYPTRAEAVRYIERAYQSQVAQGFRPMLWIAPGGVCVDVDGLSILDEINARFLCARGSTAPSVAYNFIPYTNARRLWSASLSNTSSAAPTPHARAVELLNTIQAPVDNAPDVLFGIQFHAIGGGEISANTRTSLVNALLDEALARGWQLESLEAFLLGEDPTPAESWREEPRR